MERCKRCRHKLEHLTADGVLVVRCSFCEGYKCIDCRKGLIFKKHGSHKKRCKNCRRLHDNKRSRKRKRDVRDKEKKLLYNANYRKKNKKPPDRYERLYKKIYMQNWRSKPENRQKTREANNRAYKKRQEKIKRLSDKSVVLSNELPQLHSKVS